MPVKVYDGTNWVTVAGDGQAGAPGTSSSIVTWVKTASGGETSLSGTGDSGYGTLAYTVGQELVYLNGVLLDRGDDYTATNGTSITGLTALTANDVVTVWTVNSFSVANTYTQAQANAAFAPISVTGGMTLLASGSMSGSQVSITGLSGSYETLVCYVISPTNANGENLCIRLNNDTGTNYAYTGTSSRLTTTFQSQSASSIVNDFPVIPLTGATQGWQLTIQNYTAGNYKTVSVVGAGVNSPGTKHAGMTTGMWASTSAVTEIDLFPLAGTWSGGTYEVFGVK